MSNSCKNQYFSAQLNKPGFYSPSFTGRIYMTYKSPQAIINEKSLQTSNLFEKCKKDRQTIQQLTQGMNNRVQLLSLQEAKTCRNIDQNKKIAKQVWLARNRVEKEKKEKDEHKKKEQEELKRQQDKIKSMRQQLKEDNYKVRYQLQRQKQKEQQMIKHQTKQNELMIKQFNNYYYLSNEEKIKRLHDDYAFGTIIKQLIKFIQNKGNAKIDQFFKSKKNEVLNLTKRKVQEEQFRRTLLEKQFKEFEELEARSIEKFHRTQQSEHAINQQLSNLNAIPISPSQYQQKFFSEFKGIGTDGQENTYNLANQIKSNEQLEFEKELDQNQDGNEQTSPMNSEKMFEEKDDKAIQ